MAWPLPALSQYSGVNRKPICLTLQQEEEEEEEPAPAGLGETGQLGADELGNKLSLEFGRDAAQFFFIIIPLFAL